MATYKLRILENNNKLIQWQINLLKDPKVEKFIDPAAIGKPIVPEHGLPDFL